MFGQVSITYTVSPWGKFGEFLPQSDSKSLVLIAPLAPLSYGTNVIDLCRSNSLKGGREFLLALAGLVVFSVAAFDVQGQELSVRFTVDASTPSRLKVEGNYAPGTDHWVFPNTYGRVIGLGERIKNLSLSNSDGRSLVLRKRSPGEFAADRSASRFSYEMDLSPPSRSADAAHVSWLTAQHGYLMLADLLPDFGVTSLKVEFALPPSWLLTSSAEPASQGSFQLSGKSNAVFFIGDDLSKKSKRVGATNITLVTAGEWLFSRDDALERAARIIKEYSARTRFDLKRPVTVMLAELPGEADNKGWAAETRGQNLILLANRSRAAKFSLGQLSVVLCHELLHLWVPNALSFSGDFDWFFEGFTLYQALSTAVRLGYVDFQEYLNTLSRVYGSYLASAELGKLSLIEASHRRWTSGAALVYDQGMLLAFLVDLKLRMDGRNASSLDSVYQQLLRQHSAAKDVDGNEAVTELIARLTGDQFFKRSIETPITIDLKQLLTPYGMSVSDDGKLQIIEPLHDDQRTLLRSLGYRKSRK